MSDNNIIDQFIEAIQMHGACFCLGPREGQTKCPCALKREKENAFRDIWFETEEQKNDLSSILYILDRQSYESESPVFILLYKKLVELLHELKQIKNKSQ